MFFDTSKIINDLKTNRYSYVPSNDIKIKISEINSLLRLQESWNFLSRDPYMKTGDTYRRRGFSKFKVNLNKKTFTFIDDNLFFQEEKLNGYAGGIERYLSKMNDSITDNVILTKTIVHTLNAFLEYKKKILARGIFLYTNLGLKRAQIKSATRHQRAYIRMVIPLSVCI